MRAKVIRPGDGQSINVIGDHQYIKLTGEDTGGAYTLIEQVNPPGAGVPLHVHENEDEMFHVTRGELEFTLDGKPLAAGAGTTVYLPRRVPHAFKVVGQAEAAVAARYAGLAATTRAAIGLPAAREGQ